jgi:molecular chaperone DnaJ
MTSRDYYETLGVTRSADGKELKSAYRALAMKFHPDRNPGDDTAENNFKEINQAYDVLKDEQKRAAYDRYGHQAFEQGMGANGAGPEFGDDFSTTMSDIFDQFFGGAGGGRRRSNVQRGDDLRYNMDITLEEAFEGKTAEIVVPTSIACDVCEGSGAKPGTSPVTCASCNGHGKVRASQGFFTVERTCPTCHGRGQTISDPCDNCGGAGRAQEDRTLSVNIPAGIDDGTRIRLANEGESGLHGGPSGDLYIFLSVQPHEFFQRDGSDLFCNVPLSMTDAALGGQFEVPTLDSKTAKVKVPAGTQGGKQFRLREKGMPVMRSRQMGDLYIQVQVETPRNLTNRQKELLEEFRKESSDANSPDSTGFFSRVKEFIDSFGDQ